MNKDQFLRLTAREISHTYQRRATNSFGLDVENMDEYNFTAVLNSVVKPITTNNPFKKRWLKEVVAAVVKGIQSRYNTTNVMICNRNATYHTSHESIADSLFYLVAHKSRMETFKDALVVTRPQHDRLRVVSYFRGRRSKMILSSNQGLEILPGFSHFIADVFDGNGVDFILETLTTYYPYGLFCCGLDVHDKNNWPKISGLLDPKARLLGD